MREYVLTVAYKGTSYCGWQVQPGKKTVQGTIQEAFIPLCGVRADLTGCSRTDSGVHALCNVAVFDTGARIPGEKVSYALNQRLPEDIRIRESSEVDSDFHPRHCNSKKTYEYRILNAPFAIPTRRLYTHFTYVPLDVELMQKGADYLIGEHDFKSFCSTAAVVETTVRTITDIQIEKAGNEISIRVCGTGFLYNMVRIIAGTLMEIGRGSYPPEYMKEILEAKDRQAAGPTAPACGLTLVKYEFFEKGY